MYATANRQPGLSSKSPGSEYHVLEEVEVPRKELKSLFFFEL